MFNKRIDDCNCDRPRYRLIFQNLTVNSENKCIKQEIKVNARSTKHQVHFGISHAISILISTLIDIIFVFFKNNRGNLDYNKMQPRPKMFCVSSSRYLCLVYSLRL